MTNLARKFLTPGQFTYLIPARLSRREVMRKYCFDGFSVFRAFLLPIKIAITKTERLMFYLYRQVAIEEEARSRMCDTLV